MADYSINAVARKVSFTGSAGVGPYAFSFEILDDDDVAVYFNETLLTKTTDYTVTVNANGTGSVTLVTGSDVPTTPDADDLVVIVGARDIERVTDFVTAGDLRASALNEQLDALTIMVQQVAEEVQRSVKAPVFDPTGINMILPKKSERVNAFIAFDANGDVSAAVPSDDVTTLAEVATDIATLADIEDGTVATDAISDTAAIASNVTTVAGIAANVTTVAGNTSNINAVAADATDIGTVAANIADVSAVAAIDSQVSAVAADATDIGTVATDLTGADTIGTVAGIAADVSAVAAIDTDVSAVAAIDTDVSTVAGIDSDVTAVAADSTDIGTVATNIANVNTVAGIDSDVTAVAAIDTDVTAVAGITADVTTVAGIDSDVSAVAAIDSDISTVAANISDVNNFADTYFVSATEPSSPTVGDLWFDTTNQIMKVYTDSGFANAGSSVNGTSERQNYVVGTPSGSYDGSTTVFPATYDAGFVDVYLNGVKLVVGTDFTATNGTSVTLASAAASGDAVNIIGYGTFELSNFSINDANDVSTGGVTDGQVLAYNNSTGDFEPTTIDVYDASTSSTGFFALPSGTTAQRPGSPAEGYTRYNTDDDIFEYYNGTRWVRHAEAPYNVEYLVVAGGGSGARAPNVGGGGGGAGGVIDSSVSVDPTFTYSIVIGAGGAAYSSSDGGGNNGVNTTAFNETAIGGGTGSHYNGAAYVAPTSGGSGGGGGWNTQTGASGTSGQGNNGGSLTFSGAQSFLPGAGGGGKTSVGASVDGTTTENGGNGGSGIDWKSLGTVYAGGGGGGGAIGGTGTGGGGNGGSTASPAGTNGSANTGGGGGGTTGTGYSTFPSYPSGAGGSGVVIIRYLGSQRGTGGTVTSSGGYTYHTFTSSGTFTA